MLEIFIPFRQGFKKRVRSFPCRARHSPVSSLEKSARTLKARQTEKYRCSAATCSLNLVYLTFKYISENEAAGRYREMTMYGPVVRSVRA